MTVEETAAKKAEAETVKVAREVELVAEATEVDVGTCKSELLHTRE